MRKITNCFVCNSTKITLLFETRDRMFDISGTFIVIQCRICKLLFLNPQPSYKSLTRYYPSENYYAYKNTDESDFFGKLRNYLIRHYYNPTLFSKLLTLVIPNVPAIPSYRENGQVLDIGCGIGDTLFSLQKLGWKAYGIDIDEKAVAIARNRGIKNVLVGTYKDVSKYPDNYFDAIRLYHVIEHLDDPSMALAIISKKLKKGGELIIGTPNGQSVAAGFFGKYWYNLDVPRHLMIFSPSNLQQLVDRHGFNVKDIQYYSAGGIVGSLQYILTKLVNKKITLLDKLIVVLAFYPIEWILDRLGKGDIFTLRASRVKKRNS